MIEEKSARFRALFFGGRVGRSALGQEETLAFTPITKDVLSE